MAPPDTTTTASWTAGSWSGIIVGADATRSTTSTPRRMVIGAVMRSSKQKRWPWIRIAAASCAMLIGMAATTWLTFQHKPAWYRPARVLEAQLQDIRDSLTDANLEFSAGLATGEPFDLRLDADRINQWIAAREHIFPQAGGETPSWLHDPLVAFEGGRLIVAGLVEVEDGWRAIVSAHVAVEVSGDQIHVRLAALRGGSLPLPVSTADEAIADFLRRSVTRIDNLPQPLRQLVDDMRVRRPSQVLSEGRAVENRFLYPDGDRPFSILKCELNEGTIFLRIQPL